VEQKQLDTRRLKVGDIILEKSGGGPDQPVGRVALFEWAGGPYSFSNFTSVLRLRDPERIDNRYLHYFLHWVYLSGLTQIMQTRSTGIRNLDGDAYKDILVPIAPEARQRQVVSLMEAEHASVEKLLQKVRLLRTQKRGLVQRLLKGEDLLHTSFTRTGLKTGAAGPVASRNGQRHSEKVTGL
jgi:type I restriction enzyme S subunit